jgi:hypothetical protein
MFPAKSCKVWSPNMFHIQLDRVFPWHMHVSIYFQSTVNHLKNVYISASVRNERLEHIIRRFSIEHNLYMRTFLTNCSFAWVNTNLRWICFVILKKSDHIVWYFFFKKLILKLYPYGCIIFHCYKQPITKPVHIGWWQPTVRLQ